MMLFEEIFGRHIVCLSQKKKPSFSLMIFLLHLRHVQNRFEMGAPIL
jgi:hypothetical protein